MRFGPWGEFRSALLIGPSLQRNQCVADANIATPVWFEPTAWSPRESFELLDGVINPHAPKLQSPWEQADPWAHSLIASPTAGNAAAAIEAAWPTRFLLPSAPARPAAPPRASAVRRNRFER